MNEIEHKLKQAVSHITPDVLDSILEQCDEVQNPIIVKNVCSRKTQYLSRIMGFVAVMVVFVSVIWGTSFYQKNYVVASSILVEVNSGVNIIVSENKTVLKVEALNDEGSEILKNIKVEGMNLEDAVRVIAEEIIKIGYIDAETTAVIVSVDEEDKVKNLEMQIELQHNIGFILFQNGIYVEVVSQDMTQDDELREIVQMYGVSFGKAEMMRKIVNCTYLYTLEELSKLDENKLSNMVPCEYDSNPDFMVTVTTGGIDVVHYGYNGRDYELIEKVYEHATEQGTVIDRFNIEIEIGDSYYITLLEVSEDGQEEKLEYRYKTNPTTKEIISCEVKKVPVVIERNELLSIIKNCDLFTQEEWLDLMECTTQLKKENGEWIYEMELLLKNCVGKIKLNAKTGEIVYFEKKERYFKRESGESEFRSLE